CIKGERYGLSLRFRKGHRLKVCATIFDMAKENSFDIVSNTDMAEVNNAINQTMKELLQRFDFKGSKSDIKVEEHDLIITSDDEFKIKSVNDILQAKLVKRGISLKALSYGKIESALGGTARQRIALQQGIPTDKAKEIVRFIKDTKVKVQAAIQGDMIRVSGRDRDVLQEVIA